jgi:hypothetical protein
MAKIEERDKSFNGVQNDIVTPVIATSSGTGMSSVQSSGAEAEVGSERPDRGLSLTEDKSRVVISVRPTEPTEPTAAGGRDRLLVGSNRRWPPQCECLLSALGLRPRTRSRLSGNGIHLPLRRRWTTGGSWDGTVAEQVRAEWRLWVECRRRGDVPQEDLLRPVRTETLQEEGKRLMLHGMQNLVSALAQVMGVTETGAQESKQ